MRLVHICLLHDVVGGGCILMSGVLLFCFGWAGSLPGIVLVCLEVCTPGALVFVKPLKSSSEKPRLATGNGKSSGWRISEKHT